MCFLTQIQYHAWKSMFKTTQTDPSSHLLTAFFLVFFQIFPAYRRRLSLTGPAQVDRPFQRVEGEIHPVSKHNKADFQVLKSYIIMIMSEIAN